MALRKLITGLLALAIAGCAAQDEQPELTDPSIEETRVYLETVKPKRISWIRYQEPLRYTVINNQFVILDLQTGRYLVETEKFCQPLTATTPHSDMRDQRRMRGRLRAGADTIRSCRIEAIYELPPLQTEPEGDSDGPSNQPQQQ